MIFYLSIYCRTRISRFLILLTGLIIGFLFPAQAQYEQLLHKTFAERVILLNSFYLNDLPRLDSPALFKQINAISALAEQNKDNDLLMETRLMRAHYFYYQNKRPDYVLTLLDDLSREGKKKQVLWLEIMAENMLALYNFRNLERYEIAFEHHQRVYGLIKSLSSAEFPHKQSCLLQMSEEHYFFNDYKEAISYALQGMKASPRKLLMPYSQELNLLNTLGLCYQKQNNLDSAAFYFKRTIGLSKVLANEEWLAIASGNLGYNLFLQKKYDQAVPLLQRDVQVALKHSDYGLASGSQMVLANMSILTGKANAGKEIEHARIYVNKSGQYQRLQQLYPILSKWYALHNQPVRSAIYLDSALFVRDSLNRKLNALQVLRAKQKIDLERHRLEVDHIEAQKKINIFQRNILFGVLILMLGVTLFIFREQRKKARRQGEEIKDATRQLADFSKNISEKNVLISLLESQNGTTDQEVLQQIRKSTILTEDDWTYFRDLFEKVHGGYLQRLREKLPGLTPAETRYMVLSKLGLSGREMAAMLGVGTDAIRQYRSRLRKKLNLNEEGGLEDLATHI